MTHSQSEMEPAAAPDEGAAQDTAQLRSIGGVGTFLCLLPTFVCALIMAAHFLRDWTLQISFGATFAARWDLFMVAMAITLPFLLMVRTRYVLRALQAVLFLSALDLLFTGYDIMQQRIAEKNPDVFPPGIIMAGTAAFCLFAAWLYQTKRLQARYPREENR